MIIEVEPLNYQCGVCGKTAKKKKDLSRHVESMHFDVPAVR